MQTWNDPKDTLPLAGFSKPELTDERRKQLDERRKDLARAKDGERRTILARTLKALRIF